MSSEELLLTLLIFVAATLYSSVGHAGASGYLAAMALFGVAPEVMRPTALALNILVAALAAFRYTRAGQNDVSLLLPFAASSIPAAFAGGMLHIPGAIYKPLVGGVLLLSALHLSYTAKKSTHTDDVAKPPPLWAMFITGAGLGGLAGVSGTGGGIFLSPLLLCLRWAPTRKVSGIAASFIFVNSIAGLLGNLTSLYTLPLALPYWATAALLGGVLGTHLGIRTLSIPNIRTTLALVLLVAGMKMILTK